MPIINGVKYACEPCMRGHRSSKCTHEDRLLVRVRKPGRPLSSCPHLPSGTGGVTTFVDANGARLDDSTPSHGHGAGGKPCGCEVTSLAIPKVAACACSISQCSHPSTTVTTPSSSCSAFDLNIYPQPPFKPLVSSPPTSPISPVYTTTSDSGIGRITKNTKKRKSISVNGEAILEIVNREGLLKISSRHNSIEIGTTPEMGTGPSARSGFSNENIDSRVQLGNVHSSHPVGHIPEDDQLQGNDAASVHGSQNGIFNNTVYWDQPGSPPLQQFPVQSVPTQQPKGCCNGCGPKSLGSGTTMSQNMLSNQTQLQTPMPFALPQSPSFPQMFPESMHHMQPIATTIYTYPNGYTTVNHPLTPQELRMLQATGAWSSGAAAAWSGIGVGAVGTSPDTEYSCSCGPGCECLGCAAHPFNTSTLNFVKDMRTMMYSGRHGAPSRPKPMPDQSAVLHEAVRQNCGCSSGAQQKNMLAMSNTAPHSHCHSHSGSNPPSSLTNYGVQHTPQAFGHVTSPHMASSHQHVSSPHPLQQVQNIDSPHTPNHRTSHSPISQRSASPRSPSSQLPIRPHHCRPIFPPSVSSPAYTSGSSPDPANGEDDTETEQDSVSPSAYFHIDYPLGLCSESDIGCLCGDDCACIGCMLHGNSMPNMGATSHESTQPQIENTHNNSSGSSKPGGGRGGCCSANRSDNLNSEITMEVRHRESGISNDINNHHQSHDDSSDAHGRPQGQHQLLEGIHGQETVDGQSVYTWA